MTRSAHAIPSGPIPTTYTMGSATWTQASRTAMSTGADQRGADRSVLSSSSQISSSGAAVPMWPTDRSMAKMPSPSCGASMMPAAISVLISRCRPDDPALASITANSNTSV